MKKRKTTKKIEAVETPTINAPTPPLSDLSETKTISRYEIKRGVLDVISSKARLYHYSSMTLKGDVLEVVSRDFPDLLTAIIQDRTGNPEPLEMIKRLFPIKLV